MHHKSCGALWKQIKHTYFSCGSRGYSLWQKSHWFEGSLISRLLLSKGFSTCFVVQCSGPLCSCVLKLWGTWGAWKLPWGRAVVIRLLLSAGEKEDMMWLNWTRQHLQDGTLFLKSQLSVKENFIREESVLIVSGISNTAEIFGGRSAAFSSSRMLCKRCSYRQT